MKIYGITTGLLKVNTYFLVNEESNEAIVIDGGENYDKIKEVEKINGFTVKAELLTHAHFDHSGNAKKLQDDGIKIYASALDAKKLVEGDTLGEHFGKKFDKVQADYIINDKDKINICGIEIEVIATPGHTDGSLTFKVDNNLFTGDTLFFESVGRTDFPTGDSRQMKNSISKLLSLKNDSGDYMVYAGHDKITTLSHEKEFNLLNNYV